MDPESKQNSEMAHTPYRKRLWGSYLKYVISASLVVYLISFVNFGEVFSILSKVDPLLYIISFSIFIANKSITSYRWYLLLREQGIEMSFLKVYFYYLFGFVFNLFLPSSIGGDAVKIIALINKKDELNTKRSSIVAATLFDRAVGLFSLPLIFIFFLPFNNLLDSGLKVKIIGLIIIGILFFILFLKMGILKRFENFLLSKIRNSIGSKYRSLKESFLVYKRSRKLLFTVVLLSVVFQIFGILNQGILFAALGVGVPMIMLFFAVPLVRIFTALPISIGGLGVNEIGLIGLLAIAGITSSDVVSYSLAAYAGSLLLALIFLFFYLIKKFTKPN